MKTISTSSIQYYPIVVDRSSNLWNTTGPKVCRSAFASAKKIFHVVSSEHSNGDFEAMMALQINRYIYHISRNNHDTVKHLENSAVIPSHCESGLQDNHGQSSYYWINFGWFWPHTFQATDLGRELLVTGEGTFPRKDDMKHDWWSQTNGKWEIWCHRPILMHWWKVRNL